MKAAWTDTILSVLDKLAHSNFVRFNADLSLRIKLFSHTVFSDLISIPNPDFSYNSITLDLDEMASTKIDPIVGVSPGFLAFFQDLLRCLHAASESRARCDVRLMVSGIIHFIKIDRSE